MTAAFVAIFVILWVTQMAMMYWQTRRFMRALAGLRALGDTSTGRYRKRGLRVFVAIAIVDGRVVGSQVLRGVTVFASPKPEPLLIGARVGDVLNQKVPGLTPRVAAAAAHAAELYKRERRSPRRPAPVAAA